MVDLTIVERERTYSMGNNPELEKQAEKIAKRLAKEAGQPEGLWELFLIGAYQELSKPK